MDNKNLLLVDGLGVFKSVSENSGTGRLGDKLDGLNDTRDNDVFNTRVLTLSVFTDKNSVNTLVRSLETNNGLAWSDVGEKVESSSKSQVKRDVTLTDGGSKRTLKSDKVLLDGVNSITGNGSLSIDKDGGNINRFPLNWDLGRLVNLLDSLRNFRTDTITLNQGDSIVTSSVLLTLERRDRGGISSLKKGALVLM